MALSVLQPTHPHETLLVRFLSTLEEMVGAHQRLLTLLQREKRLVIEGNSEELTPCLCEKEETLNGLDRLEKRRQEEFSALSRHFHPAEPMDHLKQLIPLVPGPYRPGLYSCQVRLEALTASIVEINQMNGLLIGRILEQIAKLLSLLKHLAFPPAGYEATGRLSDSPIGRRTLGKG